MTRIEPKHLTCAVCGETFEGYVLLSTNTMGPPDLDLRPAEMARSTLGYEIQVCPKCHYVSSDITADVSEETKSFVLSDSEFQTDYRTHSVKAYRNLMRIAVLEERYHDAFWAYLKAAWVDEHRFIPSPSPVRNEVLDFFLQHEDKLKFDGNTRLSMKAELLRRTRHFAEVIELVQNAEPSDALTDTILQFEKYLAENEDVRCYTVGSAHSWKEDTGFISRIPEKENPRTTITIDFP